jgi:hypothetical protein
MVGKLSNKNMTTPELVNEIYRLLLISPGMTAKEISESINKQHKKTINTHRICNTILLYSCWNKTQNMIKLEYRKYKIVWEEEIHVYSLSPQTKEMHI